MKAQRGLKIVEYTGFGFSVQTISDRTDKTMATQSGKGSAFYQRVSFGSQFRVYDEAKVNRLLQIEEQRADLRDEANKLFQSLEKVEP